MMAAKIERIEVDGIALAVSAGAAGLPLVMLHGIGSNAASFALLMRSLSGRRLLIAWDAPGYGASSPLAQEWPSQADYAARLRGILDRMGHARIDLVGHSLGALVAGSFAATHADRVGRLFLISPALGYATVPGAPLAKAAGDRLEAMMSEGAPRFAATRGPRLVHRPHDKPEIAAAVTAAMAEVKLPGYAQASRMLSSADLVAEAVRIEVATHVIVGADDQITPPANCRRLYDALCAARPSLGHRFHIIDDAGHAVCQEQPEEISRLLMAPTC